ncbi:MAG: hypothetical protein ABJB11_09115 [Ferruginibacter sp.]
MSNIKLFESKQIRTVWNDLDKKWYFVVEDVVAVLTDSKDPKQYIKRMRQRDEALAQGWVQFVPTLAVETAGGIQKMGLCKCTKSLLYQLTVHKRLFVDEGIAYSKNHQRKKS